MKGNFKDCHCYTACGKESYDDTFSYATGEPVIYKEPYVDQKQATVLGPGHYDLVIIRFQDGSVEAVSRVRLTRNKNKIRG